MDLDEFTEGTFHVWQPNSVELIKSSNADVGVADAPWRIGGYASTSALDRQDETVYQKGLDFNEFLQHGWFNDNHQQHTSAAIGLPETAELKAKGWYVTGNLLKEMPRAQEVYTLAKALQGTHRRLGFSIEGKILERVGNKIAKALIRNVAITNAPVNTTCTWDLMSKSWASDVQMKALDVGYQYPPVTGAGVLVPESLEGGELRVVFECPSCKKAFTSERSLDAHLNRHHLMPGQTTALKRTRKSFDRAQALTVIERIRPDWSERVRVAVVDHVFDPDMPYTDDF